jgi:hypothetical protein
MGDGEIDRRQRTRAQDRSGDDNAGRRFLMDHQIGADREDGGLKHQAQHLGDGAEAAADVAGAPLVAQKLAVCVAPALRHAGNHAHGGERLGVATAGFGEAVARDGRFGCRLARRAHERLGQQRKRNEHDRPGECGKADERMEGKADCQIKRYPGQIEQGDRTEAGEIRADGVEIAQRLVAFTAAADP